MKTLIYWFRNDLRLSDNPALVHACLQTDYLLPIYIHAPQSSAFHALGFPREGPRRQVFLRESLDALRLQLQSLGSDLLELSGEPVDVLMRLVNLTNASTVYCEQIEAPEEIDQCQRIRDEGIQLQECWQSSMLMLDDLPFPPTEMPDVFTQFRQDIERVGLRFSEPISAPSAIPPLPADLSIADDRLDQRSSVSNGLFLGGEENAFAHLAQYLERRLPDSYKVTRNQLIGQDYSSKFSPYLALGCISPRTIASELHQYENRYGANDGTYWLWFELLWRDYFRFLHFKYGRRLYLAKGLSQEITPETNAHLFELWRTGSTSEALVNAGMRELAGSGYLSNRMRQIVASYWIHDLQGDWRLGAAWFESQLIDYDVYSNQGNWLYLAGRGTDPRGGRRFNIAKQCQEHDPQGEYQRLWL